MVIGKKHAIALEKLLKEQREEKPFTEMTKEDYPIMIELERAGLVRQQTPVRWVLTYSGMAIAELLNELYKQGPKPYSEDEEEVGGEFVIREGRGLAAPEEWPDEWRFVGSEIIAMLDAANKAERVGEKSEKALLERGLAVKVWDRNRKKEYMILSDAGRTVLDIYEKAHPRLIIDDELAEFIRKTPAGPTSSDRLPLGSHEEHLLESMRLIAYSVPVSDVFAFTALGQALKKALEAGGFSKGTVLSEDIMWSLASHADGEEIPEAALSRLQELAYVGEDGELLPAGEWVLEVFRLWYDGPRKDVWTIAVEAEEVEVLRVVDNLYENYASTKSKTEMPTFDNVRRRMIDKKIAQYKKLLEKYGRRIKEMPEKFRKIAEAFEEAKDLAKWYDDNFMLRETLYSLESFNLLESVEEQNKEIFRLTSMGKQVLKDQESGERDISSTAVKSITMTRKMFSAPAIEWLNEAKEANLVGAMEPTSSGMFYAKLAETIRRLPLLTRFETEVFHVIPEKGVTENEVYKLLEERGERKERIKWALEKLEARRMIEILPDGNIIETHIGQKIDQALSGVPEGIGNPINPIIVRMLEALKSVGTLYVKERKVRILPKNIKEAQKRSGLSGEAFEDALTVAKLAGFVGKNSITTAGLLLLEAVQDMALKLEDMLYSYTEQ